MLGRLASSPGSPVFSTLHAREKKRHIYKIVNKSKCRSIYKRPGERVVIKRGTGNEEMGNGEMGK